VLGELGEKVFQRDVELAAIQRGDLLRQRPPSAGPTSRPRGGRNCSRRLRLRASVPCRSCSTQRS
jgi:hypothetical protein